MDPRQQRHFGGNCVCIKYIVYMCVCNDTVVVVAAVFVVFDGVVAIVIVVVFTVVLFIVCIAAAKLPSLSS